MLSRHCVQLSDAPSTGRARVSIISQPNLRQSDIPHWRVGSLDGRTSQARSLSCAPSTIPGICACLLRIHCLTLSPSAQMITTAIAVGTDGATNLGSGPTYGILIAILFSHGIVCSAATNVLARLNLFYVLVNGAFAGFRYSSFSSDI